MSFDPVTIALTKQKTINLGPIIGTYIANLFMQGGGTTTFKMLAGDWQIFTPNRPLILQIPFGDLVCNMSAPTVICNAETGIPNQVTFEFTFTLSGNTSNLKVIMLDSGDDNCNLGVVVTPITIPT